MGRYWGKIVVFLGVLTMLVPCCSGNRDVLTIEPGVTTGKIYVGSPKVIGRERLVNDRLSQEKWLEKERDDVSDKTFGYQGLIGRRNVYSRVIAAHILADPTLMERFQKGLTIATLLKGEDNPPAETASTTNAGTAGGQDGAGKEASEKAAADAVAINRIAKLFDDASKSVFMPSGLLEDGVEASPQDVFRDKLALREEIRTELLDNSLDDRHDLAGNNLYRLVFDTTIFPQNDTSAWAWIEVSVLNDSCEFNWPVLYREWMRRFSENLNMAASTYIDNIQNKDDNISINLSTLPGAFLSDMDVTAEKKDMNLVNWLGEEANTVDNVKDKEKRIGSGMKIFSDYQSIELPQTKTTKEYRSAAILEKYRQNINVEQLSSKEIEYLVYKTLVYRYFEKYDLSLFADAIIDKTFNGFRILVNSKPNGLNHFRCRLTEQRHNIFAYSVTPKESVQRLADASTVSRNLESLFTLQFVLGDVGGETMMKFVREQQAVYTAIKRQPLVIGFSNIEDNDGLAPPTWDLANACNPNPGPVHCRFGWIIGPRFGTSPNGQKARFRHLTIQNPVAALVSLPPWWKQVTLRVSTKWVGEDGAIMEGPWDQNVKVIKVRLPGNIAEATTALMADLPREPLPLGTSLKENQFLYAGVNAEILIIGNELWRSPEVTLGGQKAKRIEVLPSMKGIIATFEPVTLTAQTSEGPVMVDLRAWNGDGYAFVREVEIRPKKSGGSQPAPAVKAYTKEVTKTLKIVDPCKDAKK